MTDIKKMEEKVGITVDSIVQNMKNYEEIQNISCVGKKFGNCGIKHTSPKAVIRCLYEHQRSLDADGLVSDRKPLIYGGMITTQQCNGPNCENVFSILQMRCPKCGCLQG